MLPDWGSLSSGELKECGRPRQDVDWESFLAGKRKNLAGIRAPMAFRGCCYFTVTRLAMD